MPRFARIVYPGGIYHVISRFHNREEYWGVSPSLLLPFPSLGEHLHFPLLHHLTNLQDSVPILSRQVKVWYGAGVQLLLSAVILILDGFSVETSG